MEMEFSLSDYMAEKCPKTIGGFSILLKDGEYELFNHGQFYFATLMAYNHTYVVDAENYLCLYDGKTGNATKRSIFKISDNVIIERQRATKLTVQVMAAIERSVLENKRDTLSFPMLGKWALEVQFDTGVVFLNFTLPVTRTIATYESTAGTTAIVAQFFHFPMRDFHTQALSIGIEIEHQILAFLKSIQ